MTPLRGRLVLPDRVLADGVVEVEGDTIVAVRPAGDAEPVPRTDLMLLPGLVDLHCHGAAGAAFSGGAAEAERAARAHLAAGTTTVVASLVSAPYDVLAAQLAPLAALTAAGTVAGVHLEGPWLSPRHRGAHDPLALCAPDPGAADRLLEQAGGALRVVTLAPELPGALAVARRLASAGVTTALGHTGASYAQARALLQDPAHGAGLVTHLFNGMPPLHHREPGPVAAALEAAAAGTAVVELIADGVHLDDATVRLVLGLLGRDRVALVSDATTATGMPDGPYRLGELDVVLVDGVARLATADGSPGSLAGGTRSLWEIVRRTVAAGVPLVDAVRCASLVPARVLGLPRVGALEVGRRADLLVVDDTLRPVRVLRAGRGLVESRTR